MEPGEERSGVATGSRIRAVAILGGLLLAVSVLVAVGGASSAAEPAYRPGRAFGSLAWFAENRAYLERLAWENLACARRQAGGNDLGRAPGLDRDAAALAACYQEQGRTPAAARAAALDREVDFRLVSLDPQANPIGAWENPCAFLWYAALPGSPPLPPRDEMAVERAGLAVAHLSLPEGPALLTVLCWKGEGVP